MFLCTMVMTEKEYIILKKLIVLYIHLNVKLNNTLEFATIYLFFVL